MPCACPRVRASATTPGRTKATKSAPTTTRSSARCWPGAPTAAEAIRRMERRAGRVSRRGCAYEPAAASRRSSPIPVFRAGRGDDGLPRRAAEPGSARHAAAEEALIAGVRRARPGHGRADDPWLAGRPAARRVGKSHFALLATRACPSTHRGSADGGQPRTNGSSSERP